MYRLMVELVRNGYIGQLKHIDVRCRDVSFDAVTYHVKPYGLATPAPVPVDLDSIRGRQRVGDGVRTRRPIAPTGGGLSLP